MRSNKKEQKVGEKKRKRKRNIISVVKYYFVNYDEVVVVVCVLATFDLQQRLWDGTAVQCSLCVICIGPVSSVLDDVALFELDDDVSRS